MNENLNHFDTIIVGGGWAGLAAAIVLSEAGQRIAVVEASPTLGGRARAIPNQPHFDNGQHILFGTYSTVLSLMDVLNIEKSFYFDRETFYFTLLEDNKTLIPPLPQNGWGKSLQWLWRCKLSWRDKWHLLRFLKLCRHEHLKVAPYLNAKKLLQHFGASPYIIEHFWQPLVFGAMATPLEACSAHLFIQLVADAFFNLSESDFLYPKGNLSDVFPEKCAQYLAQNNQSIFLHTRALQFEKKEASYRLECSNRTLTSTHLILATHSKAASRLLSTHAEFSEIAEQLQQLIYAPITTLYVEMEHALPQRMYALTKPLDAFFIQRSFTPNIMSLVYCETEDSHSAELESEWMQVLAKRFPKGHPTLIRRITEKNAALLCTPQNLTRRPTQTRLDKHLWLCGDYCYTRYPSTLEGAVRSGFETAQTLLRHEPPSIKIEPNGNADA